MPIEEQKFPEEAKRDLQEEYDKLREIDIELSKQSRYYKARANIALLLIIIVVGIGITIFALPDMVVKRDKSLLQSVIPADTLVVNIDTAFIRYGLNNDINNHATIDTGYLKYRIEQAR